MPCPSCCGDECVHQHCSAQGYADLTVTVPAVFSDNNCTPCSSVGGNYVLPNVAQYPLSGAQWLAVIHPDFCVYQGHTFSVRLGVTLWCLGNEYSGYYCQIGASLTWAYYKPLQETWESWQTIQ